MSSLLMPMEEQTALEVEEIEVRRLDDVLLPLLTSSPKPRIFLKMDTQGYDLEVFKGAINISSHIYGLQSEISVKPLYHGMPHYLDALAVFETAGFELYDLAVVSRTAEGSLQELNCFMKRAV